MSAIAQDQAQLILLLRQREPGVGLMFDPLGWHAALFDLKSHKLVGWRPSSAVVWAAIELIWVNAYGTAFEAWVRWPLRRGPRQRRVFYQAATPVDPYFARAPVDFYFTLGYPVDHAVGLECLLDDQESLCACRCSRR